MEVYRVHAAAEPGVGPLVVDSLLAVDMLSLVACSHFLVVHIHQQGWSVHTSDLAFGSSELGAAGMQKLPLLHPKKRDTNR